jgi:hypothetical protein
MPLSLIALDFNGTMDVMSQYGCEYQQNVIDTLKEIK